MEGPRLLRSAPRLAEARDRLGADPVTAEEVIEHHRPYPNPAHCHCGWKATVDERRFYPGYVPVLQQWSAHVTAALADAGLLADKKD